MIKKVQKSDICPVYGQECTSGGQGRRSIGALERHLELAICSVRILNRKSGAGGCLTTEVGDAFRLSGPKAGC